MTDQISHTPTPPNLPPAAPARPARDTALPELKPKRHAWVWIVVLLVFALAFWWVLRGRSSSPAATAGMGRGGFGGPVTVTTATARQGQIGVYLNAIGTVTPVYTASIVSQVTGQIVDVHYREGQLVKKGDPLVDIDPRPFEATLKVAEGTLERDTHLLAQAEMDLERYKTALSRNAIAKQQVDDQEKIVLQDRGTVKLDQGNVDFDRVQLGFAHIVAPITGRVGLRLVDPGNVVNSGSSTALAVITQLQPITVVFTISEDSLQQVLSQLHKNQTLAVQALDRAQSKQLATGKLLTTDNLIDTTTGTVKMRAIFDNKDNALFPNQFVNTRLLVDTLHDVILIDSSAIQHNGTQAFVWVIQNGAAQTRNITTGATDNNLTQVTGLNAGEVVADSSFEKLQNNSKVNIVEQQGPPGQNQNQANQQNQNNGQHPNKSGRGKPNGSKSQ
ncbi:MAG TPA: efflux RND transporter periplasmic adaptor subunit [Terriglobales bacterium]|nr:efflux RND transporter periplasmic adaptor subunit [Terriglobales bacterium]